jgi:uncharacterized repeat protein (TIGR01451 family)
MMPIRSIDVAFGVSQSIKSGRILGRHVSQSLLSRINIRYSGIISGVCLLLFLWALSLAILATSSASMDVKISVPESIDLCEPKAYVLVVSSDEQAEELSAAVELPDGFFYSGSSEVSLNGLHSQCEPSFQGRSLRWDLSESLRSCRHVLINELEQNPEGPDTGKEWVELYNPTSHEVKIGGWRLMDSYYRKTITLPQDASISPEEHKVVAWTNGSLINSRAVSLCLSDSSGKTVDCTPSVTDEKDDDQCWARSPDGKDQDTDLDWTFQASTKGSSNGGRGYDLYPGESITLEFLLAAGCSARGGQSIRAGVSCNGGSSSIQSSILDVKRANLSISCIPDRFEAAEGDKVSWLVTIKNDGSGTARDILVNASLSEDMELLSINSPGRGPSWRYESLGPAEVAEVEMRTRVLSSSDYYYNLINASWGCGPCQEIGCRSEIGRRTAVRKQPDGIRSFAIGKDVDFQIEADLPPGGAGDLWINDSLPQGLIYKADSFYCRGARPKREVLDMAGGELADGEPSETRICWFFGDVTSAPSIELGYSATVANTAENQNGLQLTGGTACMVCDGSNADCDEAGDLSLVEPDLILEAATSSSAGDIGDEITCTLSVFHSSSSSSPAFDVYVQDVLPSGLSYSSGSARVLSGPPAEFDSAELKWHFDSLDLSWNAERKVLLRYNATISQAEPGDALENNATLIWSSLPGEDSGERDGSGGVNDYLRRASSRINVMRLSISKIDDPDPVNVGELLTYTLTYENQGAVAARNVTIIDELDPNLLFVFSNPPGNAGNNTWTIPMLQPDGPHSIVISALVDDTVANGTRLINRFSIESDEIPPVRNAVYTDVLNGSRLDINKTAVQKAVRRGEEVTYIIKVCNHGGQRATNIFVRDVFDSRVELIYASPPLQDGIWKFDSLDPGECVQMNLIVRVPREDVEFTSHQEIRGSGFVRVSGDYTTSLNPYVLTNKVYVTSDEGPILSDTEEVTVIGEAGTDLKIREHGSGSYENSEHLHYLSSNKSLKLEKLMEAHHQPTSFQLQGNRSERFASRWSESVLARNGITGSSFIESYRHVVDLDSKDDIHMDENGSKISLVSDFHGPAHFSMSKKDCKRAKGAEDIFESQEDYAGSFIVQEVMQEHGCNVLSEESVSGAGYASLDKRVWDRQRSYESGTGPLHLDETIQSSTGFLYKRIDAKHEAVSYPFSLDASLTSSQEWKEGLWAHGERSFLGERYFSIEHLKKEAVLRGVNELESEANFSGRAEFRVAYKDEKNKSTELDLTNEFAGEYNLTRRVLLAGICKYNEPHLSIYLADSCDLANSSLIRYTITVRNDGNTAIGPIYLRDLFPPGTEYIGSSVGPSELTPGHANWTLLSLGIGGSSTIDLRLNVTEDVGSPVNRVEAAGCHDGQWVTAANFSVIQTSWLSCCQSNLLVPKEAILEPGTNNIVDYRIILHNPWNYTMAAVVVDRLPGGMRLQSSSLQPSDFDSNSNQVTWIIIDLPPGQTKTIEYRAEAQQKGVLVNRARVEAYGVGGPDAVTAEASAEIEMGEGKSGDVGRWKVPACFGLNYSTSCAGGDLAACYSCSAPDEKPEILCASCISPEQEP